MEGIQAPFFELLFWGPCQKGGVGFALCVFLLSEGDLCRVMRYQLGWPRLTSLWPQSTGQPGGLGPPGQCCRLSVVLVSA